jgi:hypothetical protein
VNILTDNTTAPKLQQHKNSTANTLTDNTTPPKLQHFRQILFWPLRLFLPENVKEESKTDGFARAIERHLTQSEKDRKNKWKVLDDLQGRGMGSEQVTRYAEFVYFHPFIRRFLYGDPYNPDNEKALHICQRTDVKTVQITLRKGQTYQFNVDRIHLYLFNIEATLLVVEISSTNLANAPLCHIENLLDQFRHAYPPYWDKDGAGHSPKTVIFFDENQDQLAQSEYNNQQHYLDFVEKHQTSPVAYHWSFLLKPFVPRTLQKSNKKSNNISYEQIEDERIPHMAFLAFDKITSLSKGDLMRLAFADEEGGSNTLPCSTLFSEDFEAKYCYDRFWENPEYQGKNPQHNWMTTRYLCCGYAFTMIGQGGGFFTDVTAGAVAHFRHHYFQMGLIAHFHKAALLMLWDELAQAVAKFRKEHQSRQQFHDEVRDILEKLLHFTHRYWFTEVSNQIQAKELFDMWSKHLGNRELFDRIMKEAQDAHQYLEMDEQKQQTETTVRLTVVATLGLAIIFTLGFFGSNPTNLLGWEIPYGWKTILIVLSSFGAGVLFTVYHSKMFSCFIEVIAEKRFWKKTFWRLLWHCLKKKKVE